LRPPPRPIYPFSLPDALPIFEDTMAALVRYTGGVQMTYTLHAYMPFEGWRIAFNGTKGRLEAGKPETYVPQEQRNFAARSRAKVDRKSTRLNSSHVNISYAVF